MLNKEVAVGQTFREGNSPADFLTNFIVDFAGEDIQFNHTNELPNQAKTLLQLDKQGTPILRLKKGQNNHFKHSR